MVKAGVLWSGRAGTGIVVARLEDGSWSAPAAICAAGVGVGAQFGLQQSDIVFVLNTRNAVRAFSTATGNITLGGNISVAAGPTGRSSEAAGALIYGAPIYSYSKSKGAFVGVSLEGTVLLPRKRTNAAFYGRGVSMADILGGNGVVPRPVVAEGLYRMLEIKFGGMPGYEGVGALSRVNDPRLNDIHRHSTELPTRGSGTFSGTINGANSTAVVPLAAAASFKPLTPAAKPSSPMFKPLTPANSNSQSTIRNTSESEENGASPTRFSSGSRGSNKGPPPLPPKKPSKTNKPAKCVALYDYNTGVEGDLTFRKGDVIWSTSKNFGGEDGESEWMEGSLSGVKGIFPSSYIQLA